MKEKLFLLILFVLIRLNCFSQSHLTVTADSTATLLAQTIAGSGVIVSNATLNCNGQAIGNFSYSGTNLGLTNGIILSTGLADSSVYNPNSQQYPPSYGFGTMFSDPNLTAIEPLATNDVCIIAFDFVPTCNSLSITFVFASSEYDGFVCEFNDAFGIFLTGPNPAGGNYTGLNIATLPGGIPVTINNVNDGNPNNPPCPPNNNNYFVNNLNINLADSNQDIAYPGYTIPITSVTSVSPCATYHMEIAIADAGDDQYDSAVFIEGNSVSCVNTPTVTVSATPETCGILGSATVTVTNYTATPTYSWQPGGATTASISNLTPGTYSCEVGLQLGCGNATQTVIAVVSPSSTAFSFTTTSQNPLCHNGITGNASVVIGGGTAPYTYTWTTNPVQTTATAINLAAGTYTVNVTDNIGCKGDTVVTLTNPPLIVTLVNTSPTTCTSSIGSATVSIVSGGTAPFTYAWITNPVQTGSVAINLGQATYSVVTEDVNHCSVLDTGTVQVAGYNWTIAAAASPAKCFGVANGSATVTITNPGANTFNYLWTPSLQTNQIATNLSVGSYTITVQDDNGCLNTASIVITQPTQLVLVTLTTPAICITNNGTANVTTFGGVAPYTYNWSITNPIQTTQTAVGLSPGQYTAFVTDANNCMVAATVMVNDTSDLVVTATQSPDLCNKGVGKAIANPVGAQPYTYTWTTNPIQNTQTADNLVVGNYSVSVTDAYGCNASASTTVINKNDALNTQFTTNPSGIIYAENSIIIDVVTNQGWTVDTTAYLSNGVLITKNPFTYTFPQYGDYTATYYFTSIHGCKDTITYDIIVKDYITLYIPNTFTPNGDGKNDVFEAQGTFINSFQMYIYDRWGVLVKQFNSITNTWDGTKSGGPAPEDTYVYKGTASDIFGKQINFQGQVNLLR
jgi:gliding motility-associated-like protein